MNYNAIFFLSMLGLSSLLVVGRKVVGSLRIVGVGPLGLMVCLDSV